MKTYVVGGAVRDELLGLAVKDRDYVVVGATPEDMQRQGFKPVGKDFPVFLHPETKQEYALARTERKTAPGYKGFHFHAAPDVTLEQDLARRDLTINALAKDDAGRLIDPYGGLADLQVGVLRHVSPAFVEDPVRVLRVARFAARFGFIVAPETMQLMRDMSASGEVDALVPERVWQEFGKGLMEDKPTRMFEVLRDSAALPRVLPQWERLDGQRALAALAEAAKEKAALPVRYATLWCGATEEDADTAADTLKAPGDCKALALLAARYGEALERAQEVDAETLIDLLQRVDAFRRFERFSELLQVCRCDARGRGLVFRSDVILPALAEANAVDAAAIARAHPERVAEALREARIAAVRKLLD